MEHLTRSDYWTWAALVSAKVHCQAGDLKTALAQLQWVVEHSGSDEIRAIATLRMASVLLDDNEPDAALKILEAKPHPGFEALYASQRGDILSTQKKPPEPGAAYKAAMERADAGS